MINYHLGLILIMTSYIHTYIYISKQEKENIMRQDVITKTNKDAKEESFKR